MGNRECNQIPRQHCWTDQVEECYPVTKQNCRNVPEQVCKDVEKQRCEIIHTKTPQSKANQKAIRVCDNNIGSSNDSEFARTLSSSKQECGTKKRPPLMKMALGLHSLSQTKSYKNSCDNHYVTVLW